MSRAKKLQIISMILIIVDILIIICDAGLGVYRLMTGATINAIVLFVNCAVMLIFCIFSVLNYGKYVASEYVDNELDNK